MEQNIESVKEPRERIKQKFNKLKISRKFKKLSFIYSKRAR